MGIHSRKGAMFTLGTFMLLIVGIITVTVLFFVARNMGLGASGLFDCDGYCYAACPDGTRADMKGDSYCKEHFDGTKAGGPKCCLSLTIGDDQVVNPGDVRLTYTTKSKDPLQNGAAVALIPKYKNSAYSVEGIFALAFVGDAAEKECYWRVGEEDWQEDVIGHGMNAKEQFQIVFSQYYKLQNDPSYDESRPPTATTSETNKCGDLEGRAPLNIPFTKAETGGETVTHYTDLFGKRIKYTLVMVDPENCKDTDVDLCENFEFSVFVDIPDRRPQISFKVNDKQVGTKDRVKIPTEQTNNFDFVIKEPYSTCKISYDEAINLSGALKLPFTPMVADGLLEDEPRCFKKEYKERYTLFIPKEHAKAIPFDITVNTSIANRALVSTYKFQIAPEERVRVTGPSPGYAREKFVDISCHDVSCNTFKAAYTKHPLECKPGTNITSEAWTNIESLRAYGGTESAMWRFSVKDESLNGKYLCIKAETDDKDTYIYSLGLHQDLPSKVAIDATPPHLTAHYDPVHGLMKMGCEDQGVYQSGCANRPFSYAYVVNPLQFAGSVLTLGLLDADWSGCPDPDTGHYVTWNGADGEMPYLQQDVRVMCIKATDNSGNSVVKSRLAYGSAEVLGGFLMAYARNQ